MATIQKDITESPKESPKKTHNRSISQRPKHISSLEEDFVVRVTSTKNLSHHQDGHKSLCMCCSESFLDGDMNFINCKLRGYRKYNYGVMKTANVAVCVACFEKWMTRSDTCLHCRGPCCKQEIKKNNDPFKFVGLDELIDGEWVQMSDDIIPIRFSKKKKSFAEREVDREIKLLKKKKKIKKTLLVELVSCGFNRRQANNLINKCAKDGIKLKLHLWKNRINTLVSTIEEG